MADGWMDRKTGNDGSTSIGSGKYLNFRLGQEAFSIPVLKVREIIRLRPITPVPRMPSCIKGVINLRGKIVAVMDLRKRLEFSPIEYDEHACIVILQSQEGESFGLIVDCVEDVTYIRPEDVETPPSLRLDVNAEFVAGLAKAKDGVKIILNAHRLLDFTSIQQLLENPS